MTRPLSARLPARYIFVVGKGGVGKTTTAGELAMEFATRAEATHLISTDPAHSLRDFLEQQQFSSPHLSVEELDARARADALFARIQPALVELIERGTYLDQADARSFLDLSFPGMDEIMAALRLVELGESGAMRIVVDTAPTGHTLRMLESGRVLRSWVAAGRAMVAKAAAVVEQLMRRGVRFAAEDVLDDLETAAHRFDEIIESADFVVVTRPGAVIAAETERLTAELTRRGYTIRETTTVQAGQTAATQRSGDAADWLRGRSDKLVWVAGKGGVGKSTCAAALGVLYAETRTVCVVSTDPAGSLSEIFASPVTRSATAVSERLYAQQIDATAEFDRMRAQYQGTVERVFESLGLEKAAQLDRKVVEALFDFAPPGIDEIIALVEILEQAGDYDIMIIDSAPTGHFLRLLAMPDIALEWVHALLRLLLKYHAAASLDALGQDLLAFAKRLRQLTFDAVYVVALPEPMVIAETERLIAALHAAQIPIAAVILNHAAHDTQAVSSKFRQQIITAPNTVSEIIGISALHNFLTQWQTEERTGE